MGITPAPATCAFLVSVPPAVIGYVSASNWGLRYYKVIRLIRFVRFIIIKLLE